MPDDTLADFEVDTFTHDGKPRTIYRKGMGPAVIVLAEIPGITPKVAGFARRVADIGCTAVMPHLFGTPGRDPLAGGRVAAVATVTRIMIPICISREFVALATDRTSPVIDWVRALAAHEHERCGGPGVGVVGMCFTGGFALATATEPAAKVAVMSQPSLPFARKKTRRTIDLSPADLDTVAGRCAAGDLDVIGLRFTCDRLVPAERFALLRERLGDAFIGVELAESDANPDSPMPPHSVLTEHLVDEPGTATRDALDLVLDHFRRKLVGADGQEKVTDVT